VAEPITTEDLVSEAPGDEDLLPAEPEDLEKIEPYAGATPVTEGWSDDTEEPTE